MDVIQERLEREFGIDLIMTAPSVVYHINTTDGETLEVANPSEFPDPTRIENIEEPFVKAQIMVPQEYVGAVMELAQRKRGDFETMEYIDDNRVNVIYQIPLAEIVFDFFDKLKSSRLRQVILMTKSEKRMWLTNIENAADAVAAEYGSEVAQSVFQRYDAHGTYDLSPCYYSEVFADLELIANDN